MPERLTTGHVYDEGLTVGAAAGNPPCERRRAARTVASMAVDAAESETILAMLGLTAWDGQRHEEAA